MYQILLLLLVALTSTSVLAAPTGDRSPAVLSRDVSRMTNAQRLARGLPLIKPTRVYTGHRARQDPAPSGTPEAEVFPQAYIEARRADGSVLGYMGYTTSGWGIVDGARGHNFDLMGGESATDASIRALASDVDPNWAGFMLPTLYPGWMGDTSYMMGGGNDPRGTAIWSWDSSREGTFFARYRINDVPTEMTFYVDERNAWNGQIWTRAVPVGQPNPANYDTRVYWFTVGEPRDQDFGGIPGK